MNWFGILVVVAVGAKWAGQLWLEWLNARHVRAHAGSVPKALQNVMDGPTAARTVQYTLAKSRFRKIELTYDAAVLLLALLSGVLPAIFGWFESALGISVWAKAVVLFVIGTALSLLDLPFAWWAQFRLEEQFGFNTSTQRIWWTDRLKG